MYHRRRKRIESIVVILKLLYINSEIVIPAEAGIQLRNTGFPRIKYGAGSVKPGMTKYGSVPGKPTPPKKSPPKKSLDKE